MEQVLNFAKRKGFYLEKRQLWGFIFPNFIKIYNSGQEKKEKKEKKKETGSCVVDSFGGTDCSFPDVLQGAFYIQGEKLECSSPPGLFFKTFFFSGLKK